MSIVYYQVPFIRCPELDIIFGATIAMCLYLVTKPLMSSESNVSASEKSNASKADVSEPEIIKNQDHHVYSVDYIRSMNTGVIGDSEYTFEITSRPVEYRQSRSPIPFHSRRSPDPYNYFRNHSPEPEGFVSRSPPSRLDSDEEKDFVNDMTTRTNDYIRMDPKDIPKDIQVGRVQYLKKTNGRIQMQQPVNGVKYVFFHLRDCELNEGETIQLGDTVMFELDIFENRLCAVKVKKTVKIPSPDFSRRSMKHSKEVESQIADFQLYSVC